MNFERLKDFQILTVGCLLALALIISVNIIANNISDKSVTATGTANKIVTSDSANWVIEITSKDPSKAQAYTKIKAATPIVLKYLKDNKINEKDINIATPTSFPTWEINPKTGNATNEISYYNYSQKITVSSKDVKHIQQLSGDIQSLLNSGIDINSNEPEYYYTDIAKLKVELLEDATKDAKNRANAMLKATRNKVRNIKSVKMGVFQITKPTSTEVSDWGINDTSTIEKKVTAVASVVFEVK